MTMELLSNALSTQAYWPLLAECLLKSVVVMAQPA